MRAGEQREKIADKRKRERERRVGNKALRRYENLQTAVKKKE